MKKIIYIVFYRKEEGFGQYILEDEWGRITHEACYDFKLKERRIICG